jgi:hypothetical protein
MMMTDARVVYDYTDGANDPDLDRWDAQLNNARIRAMVQDLEDFIERRPEAAALMDTDQLRLDAYRLEALAAALSQGRTER